MEVEEVAELRGVPSQEYGDQTELVQNWVLEVSRKISLIVVCPCLVGSPLFKMRGGILPWVSRLWPFGRKASVPVLTQFYL